MSREIHCEKCGQTIKVASADAGKTRRCPKCSAAVRLPSFEEAARLSSSPRRDAASAKPSAESLRQRRIAALCDIGERFSEQSAENDRMHWGCLLGVLLPPLGFWQLIRMGRRQRRTNEALSAELDRLAEKWNSSRAALFDDAVDEPRLSENKKFLQLLCPERWQQQEWIAARREQQVGIDHKAEVWNEYAILPCEELTRGPFVMPAICGTCGVAIAADLPPSQGVEIILKDRINALQRTTTSIRIPQCGECAQRKSLLEGLPRPRPTRSQQATILTGQSMTRPEQPALPDCIGLLHRRFVESFLRSNHPSGPPAQVKKCDCGIVYWTGSHPVCPGCVKP